jgi:hypothetical protein
MQVEVDNNSPMDFHFLVVSAVEQMRSPVLRDSFTTVTLPRHDRKQRMRERMALRASDEDADAAGDKPPREGSFDREIENENENEDNENENENESDDQEQQQHRSDKLKGRRRGSSATGGLRPEKWFAAEMLKGQRSTHNLEFTIEEDDTNGPPWNMPHSAYVEQRYVLHAKIRRKEGRSLILGALEPSADSSPVVFVAPSASAVLAT